MFLMALQSLPAISKEKSNAIITKRKLINLKTNEKLLLPPLEGPLLIYNLPIAIGMQPNGLFGQ